VSHHLQESFSHNAYSTNSYIGPGPRARDLRAGRKLLIVPFVKVEASSKTGKKRKAGKEAASSDKKASKRGGKSAESSAAKGGGGKRIKNGNVLEFKEVDDHAEAKPAKKSKSTPGARIVNNSEDEAAAAPAARASSSLTGPKAKQKLQSQLIAKRTVGSVPTESAAVASAVSASASASSGRSGAAPPVRTSSNTNVAQSKLLSRVLHTTPLAMRKGRQKASLVLSSNSSSTADVASSTVSKPNAAHDLPTAIAYEMAAKHRQLGSAAPVMHDRAVSTAGLTTPVAAPSTSIRKAFSAPAKPVTAASTKPAVDGYEESGVSSYFKQKDSSTGVGAAADRLPLAKQSTSAPAIKNEGHAAHGSSLMVCLCVCVHMRVLLGEQSTRC